MSERITFWKCPECKGIGKIAPFYSDRVEECLACDGTGNAFVDGEEQRMRRRIADLGRKRDSHLGS